MFLPRSQTPRWYYLIGPVLVVLFLWLPAYVPDSALRYYVPALLTYHGALIALLWFGKLRAFIWERRALINFRALSREEQDQYLRSVWPSGLRAEYLRLVDLEESYRVDGRDASYPFPMAERRLHQRLLLAVLGFLILMLTLWLLFPSWPAAVRMVPAVLGILASLPAAWLLGRMSLLATTLHVSPFSVEIRGPTLPRRLSLNQPLRLTNHPAKGYFALEAPLTGQGLRIHHARIGVLHAYRLICDNGQFETIPADPPAAT